MHRGIFSQLTDNVDDFMFTTVSVPLSINCKYVTRILQNTDHMLFRHTVLKHGEVDRDDVVGENCTASAVDEIGDCRVVCREYDTFQLDKKSGELSSLLGLVKCKNVGFVSRFKKKFVLIFKSIDDQLVQGYLYDRSFVRIIQQETAL